MATSAISRPTLPKTGDLMTTFDLLNLFCIVIISAGVATIVLATLL